MRELLRRPVTWVVVGVVAAVVVAGGLWLFQPWKLFVDQTVNEALPSAEAVEPTGSASPARQPVVLAEGTFITHEHDTSGAARIVELADGRTVLSIEKLDTSNGPDLRVWLTDQPVKRGQAGWFVFDDGKYVELGRLKGNKGNQVYEIPDNVDISDYRSVSIWCKRFSVSFGAAELTAA